MIRWSIHTLALALAAAVPATHAIEEPAYTISRQDDGFEPRHYPPVLTAEVTGVGPAATDGCYTVQLTMPAAYTLATLPAPQFARIRLKQLVGKGYVVTQNCGFLSGVNDRTHLAKSEQAAQAARLAIQGAPVDPHYYAPWMPCLRRRSEILRQVP